VLAEILGSLADSEMGHARGFDRCTDPETFRRTVPVTDYEDMRGWIDEMRRTGDPRVMFGPGTQLIMFTLTSGSESEPKHIPVTRRSYHQYRRGWMTWLAAALQDYPDCFDHRVLPIVSPPIESHTASGIPCGSMSGLSTETQSRFIRSIYAVPGPIYGLSNQADKYYALARWGAGSSVSFLVTANPSSFLMLAQVMDTRREQLIRDVHDGTLGIDVSGETESVRAAVGRLRPDPARAGRLEQVVERTGRLLPKDVWPALRLMTNWKGGTLGHYLDLYPEAYGDTPVRDIGLLASEGRMSIPMDDHGSAGPLDLFAHFYEFMPVEDEGSRDPTLLMAHEVEAGRDYFIHLTNFSGLHRYSISDVVRVEDLHHGCPVIRFLHKGSRYSSITGEKISENQVTVAVRRAAQELGCRIIDFMLVPVWRMPPCYALVASAGSLGERALWPRLLQTLECRLQELNIEYLSKRKSQRLGPVCLALVDQALFSDMRLERIASSGGRSEQYKPTYLSGDLEFHRGLDVLEWIRADGGHETEQALRR
jgi:hypothetical protein